MAQAAAYAQDAALTGKSFGYELGTGIGIGIGAGVGGILGGTSGWVYHMSPCCAAREKKEKEPGKPQLNGQSDQFKAVNVGKEAAGTGANIGATITGVAVSIPMALAFLVVGGLVGLSVDAGNLCCGAREPVERAD
mmetsp:Transcript_16866/g.39593  ORF Transcript_16866/g.39593 Transcript_16866/m.39593 type:complete len:136 (+) Transcript_16866:97-504(+)|eukprot:CAMPEP_0171088894 /NCGR_PEP_ID=MMETSP0766_2-20121228/21057_1 /TAXON_ID=439317 /ORGANISM="Gambierdiscus australes, Strain CAWD 149" /LENGTH=135 /DNA_ID=CAMNT_0011546719 /DNA_START=100 /DNA_END=507 /DNA_ORIENTATION=-